MDMQATKQVAQYKARKFHKLNFVLLYLRRVSYIIYLTDPEDPWTPQDGGNLELYPLVEGTHHTPFATCPPSTPLLLIAGTHHTPAVHPSICHLPTFNTMVMFTVLPGKSFHAVQCAVVELEQTHVSCPEWGMMGTLQSASRWSGGFKACCEL
eukprot:1162018-Pelagomonas_calceolata.AAC.6